MRKITNEEAKSFAVKTVFFLIQCFVVQDKSIQKRMNYVYPSSCLSTKLLTIINFRPSYIINKDKTLQVWLKIPGSLGISSTGKEWNIRRTCRINPTGTSRILSHLYSTLNSGNLLGWKIIFETKLIFLSTPLKRIIKINWKAALNKLFWRNPHFN